MAERKLPSTREIDKRIEAKPPAEPKQKPKIPVADSGALPGPQGPRRPRQPGGQATLPTTGRKQPSTAGG